MKKMKVTELCLCALFAALTAVLSQIAIPIKPVPINLATFSVFLAGALLGAKGGTASLAVYVLLGAAGLPVFSSFNGGIGVLAGPTGGYIIGYILAAFVIGIIADKFGHKIYVLIPAMLAGFLTYMTAGTAWYMFSTSTGLTESIMLCVVPFIPGDAVKLAVAAILTRCLRPVLQKKLKGTQNAKKEPVGN